MFNLAGVSKTYAPGIGITGVDLQVNTGEIHALIGLNGAGKTTLMRVGLGMSRPNSGTVSIGGVVNPPSGSSVWARVGHMVEQGLLYPELPVGVIVDVALRLRGVTPPDRGELVTQALGEFGLSSQERVRVERLSQGNQQRLKLAIALAHHPDVVILDEPTNALDPAGMIALRDILTARANQGMGVLVSSHHLDEVSRIAHRITVINRGRIIGGLNPGSQRLERDFFELIYDDDTRHGMMQP